MHSAPFPRDEGILHPQAGGGHVRSARLGNNLQHQSLSIEIATNYQYLSYTRRLSRYHAAPVNIDGDNENEHATYKTL
jgi:hypothetical protein